MMINVFDRVENIVGKGENAGHQHFLLFPQCFQNHSFVHKELNVFICKALYHVDSSYFTLVVLEQCAVCKF